MRIKLPAFFYTSWLRHLKPLKLDLYILTEVWGPFFGGIVFFCFIFLMLQLLRLAEFLIVHGVSIWILLKMMGLFILSSLPLGLPIAFLVGVLVAFGRLSADSELVAMKANGISVARLSAPVVAMGLLVVWFSFALNMEWVPWGDRTSKSLIIRVSNTKVVSSIREGTFTTGFFDLLVYADKLDTRTNRLHRVFIFDEREPKNPLAVVAKEGELLSVKPTSLLGAAAVMKLYKGNIHSNDIREKTYQKIDFDQYKLFLKIDEGAENFTIKPRMYSLDELNQHLAKAERGSSAELAFRTEYWRRIGVALTPLIFVFLGIGFGTVKTRSVRSGAFLVAIITIVIYWGIQAWALAISTKGFIPPPLAMMLPNLVMLAMAIKAYRTASW